MGNRETTLGRFLKLFAIIAVAIAAVFCMLVGCGSNRREAGNINESKTEVESKTDVDENDNNGNEGDEYNNVTQSVNYYACSNFTDEYALDSFEFTLSYSFDEYNIKKFHCPGDNYNVFDLHSANLRAAYVYAYKDIEDKYTDHYYWNRQKLAYLDALLDMQPGETTDELYLADSVVFPQDENGNVDWDSFDFSAYSRNKDENGENWIYTHNVQSKIPYEFFDDMGKIYFEMIFFVEDKNGVIWTEHGIRDTRGPEFSYLVEDDEIVLTDFYNGRNKVREYINA